MFGQALMPGELVGVFRAGLRVAVGRIETSDQGAADGGLDVAARHLRKILRRLRELLGAEELDVDAAVGARLDVGGETLQQLGQVVRRRHLVRHAHDDGLRGRDRRAEHEQPEGQPGTEGTEHAVSS